MSQIIEGNCEFEDESYFYANGWIEEWWFYNSFNDDKNIFIRRLEPTNKMYGFSNIITRVNFNDVKPDDITLLNFINLSISVKLLYLFWLLLLLLLFLIS
jgi:hypothetical protein